MNWIKTSDRKPKSNEVVIGLILEKFSNAPWEWSWVRVRHETWDKPRSHWNLMDGGSCEEPYYWARVELPRIPRKTKK